ncbi:hypothetical protein ABFT23_08495 [Nocardioides sp. C4-1]|uniref:hypothetical protein n=1 Tax=Nocardioides sp. C4-1 TaxID=3151851 RepID=UPI003265C862
MRNVPESLPWLLSPFGVLLLLALWGIAAPRSQWRVLYSWQHRYREHEHPADQHDLVFQTAVVLLGLAIAGGALVTLGHLA